MSNQETETVVVNYDPRHPHHGPHPPPQYYIDRLHLIPGVNGDHRRRILMRTVQNGCIRIFGHNFVPDDRYREYDDRFEGRRYCFLLIADINSSSDVLHHEGCVWYCPVVFMERSASYHSQRLEHANNSLMEVDGYEPWNRWHLVRE